MESFLFSSFDCFLCGPDRSIVNKKSKPLCFHDPSSQANIALHNIISYWHSAFYPSPIFLNSTRSFHNIKITTHPSHRIFLSDPIDPITYIKKNEPFSPLCFCSPSSGNAHIYQCIYRHPRNPTSHADIKLHVQLYSDCVHIKHMLSS